MISIRQNLKDRHAEFLGQQHEHDIYYNAPHRDFGSTDEALRVRYTKDHAVITYKGKKCRESGSRHAKSSIRRWNPGRFSKRSSTRLGFTKTAEVNKWRENYRLENASFALDRVEGLGTFAEIEIMAEDNGADATGTIIETCKRDGDFRRADPRLVSRTAPFYTVSSSILMSFASFPKWSMAQ